MNKFINLLSRRPTASPELLTLIVSVAFTLFYNNAFWQKVLDLHSPALAGSWLTLIGYGVLMTLVQYIVYMLFATRYTAKPVLIVLMLVAASISYFTSAYHTYFDTTMVVNTLQTDSHEASELITAGFFKHLLIFAGLPILILLRFKVVRSGWKVTVFRKVGYFLSGVVLLIGSALLIYQSFASEMRNNPEMRYLLTPGNYVVSLARVLTASEKNKVETKIPLTAQATYEGSDRPKLIVMVVGETTRAANWGLNGYDRQTTPELANRDLVNYSNVTSCGTSTAVSVPCMFSPWGRDNYDESAIDQHEALLDVLKMAGYDVLWIDNQSGCKGVCDRIPSIKLDSSTQTPGCGQDECFDDALREQLQVRTKELKKNTVIVLHEMGNHGPSYYKRYPKVYEKFTPVCQQDDLSKCDVQSIKNAYDNAIFYNDHVLSGIIDYLETQDNYDSTMLYASDHGESLGENGVYLHGLPYLIAPDEQTHVPMIWWLSKNIRHDEGIDYRCIQQAAGSHHSHANLFHTILGLAQVKTDVYDVKLDMAASCQAS
ncbi:MAG: lipid A phosphoethanolamine transferase [Salinicola sp.]|uniref:phosphoethanolamine transferase n=1 Tax=uncultured Salinicola sp. TaxID=1193542 RepID=UPI000C9282D3|nr:phosphoethanolamine--lipid A transferase [uncultured Salinicola sp.]MAM58527.1 lipid A phosphoethanolamine transferase [Salinicola sp.]|tara:strand:- start:21 stop:1649 length:1629 start_codon:yes stop_codon:yes gene_type:complete